ncbi:MAG: DUF5668 domain-containing protein [Oscillospiraceae bacterium]|nr:DUF5668 domain-containing protein [Oscillospiraceae bacterium]
MKTRRVGSFTAGFTLVASGVLFLLNTLSPERFDPASVLRWWPVMLILLGTEILLASFTDPEKVAVKYDFLSVILMLLCLFGSFACAFAQLWMMQR